MPLKETNKANHASPPEGPLDEWEIIEKRLDAMSQKEVLQTFVSAGILTEKGNVTKPYLGVFKKIPQTS